MPLPPDLHVHTEWSWDAPLGSMERSCERALEVGLPAIAFREQADWALVHQGQHSVDRAGYFEAVERCRAKFKGPKILTGVELGEPHWFPKETAAALATGPLDQVFGSIHCIRIGGGMGGASPFRGRAAADFAGAGGGDFRETRGVLEGGQTFQTLAHTEYPE